MQNYTGMKSHLIWATTSFLSFRAALLSLSAADCARFSCARSSIMVVFSDVTSGDDVISCRLNTWLSSKH
jgi:hypothetical protein